MTIKNTIWTLLMLCWLIGLAGNASAQNKKFYIFLCLGQSNMEGSARFEPQDTIVSNRFRVLQVVDCPELGRTKGNWYTAKPPLCRCKTGLNPADYFGRTLLEHLPEDVTIGIINVSVAGAKIEIFDQDTYQAYLSTAPGWMKNMAAEYDGNPYARLVEMGRLAKKQGVIKGVLLHQGESNTNDTLWTGKVKKLYNRLLKDLSLKPSTTPLLAGEVVNADQGGICASMNKIIATLPQVIPNAHVISSAGCNAAADHLHFDAAGYRTLGKRYGVEMLRLLGVQIKDSE